jgi:hypothetical protein
VNSPALNWWHPDPAALETAERPPEAGRTAFVALVLFTGVLVAAPQEFVGDLQPFRLALVAAIIAIACHALDLLNKRLPAAETPREIPLVLALVGWCVVMVPLSYWPGGSVSTLLDLYFKSVAVFILLAGVVNTRARLRIIAWTLAACAVPIALVALQHFATGQFLPNAPGRIVGYGTAGLAGNPNDLALLLNLTLPFISVLIATSRSALARLIATGILIAATGAVIVTFSRGGFITLSVVAILYAWRLVRRGKGLAIAGLAAIVLVVVFGAPAGYGDRLGTISSVDSDPTGSAQARWRDIVVASEFAIAHPILGAGPGQDILALNEMRGNAWVPVHNMYLNYAVDLGVIGLGLFLAIFWSVLSGVIRVERALAARGFDDDLSRFACAARVSLIALAVAGFFYPIPYQAFFYYIAGLAIAIRRIAQVDAERAAASPATASA